MSHFARAAVLSLFVSLALAFGQRAGHAAEIRFALVIGNDQYKAAQLATPANDAGLVADALQSAGFTVTGARNLDQATLRESFREFLGQVSSAGPDAVALVYLAGIGLQFEGENYFVPVDAAAPGIGWTARAEHAQTSAGATFVTAACAAASPCGSGAGDGASSAATSTTTSGGAATRRAAAGSLSARQEPDATRLQVARSE